MFVGGCNSIGNWFEGLLPIYAIDHLSRKPVPTFRNDLARYRAFESLEKCACANLLLLTHYVVVIGKFYLSSRKANLSTKENHSLSGGGSQTLSNYRSLRLD